MTLLILQGLTHGGKFVMKEADNTTQKGATKAHQSGQRYLSTKIYVRNFASVRRIISARAVVAIVCQY